MGLFGFSKKRKSKVINRINVEENGTPLFIFKYKLTLQDFREYNMAVSADNIASDRRRKRVWGIAELLGAAAFGVIAYLNWADTYARQTYIVAMVLLLLLGLYTITFYRLFFDRKLEKSSRNYYENSVYLQNYITQAFYEDGMLEKAAPRDGFFRWDRFQRAWNSENLFYLEFNLANQLILPIREITAAGHTLEEMLNFCNSHIEVAKKVAALDAWEESEELPEENIEEQPGKSAGDRAGDK